MARDGGLKFRDDLPVPVPPPPPTSAAILDAVGRCMSNPALTALGFSE